MEALWQVNDDWSALLSQSYQNMEADGSSAQYIYGSDYQVNPAAPQVLGPWEGTFFTPTWDKDKFTNTALTLNGKVGDLSLVYSGAYLVRHVDQTGDYTNYARSVSGYYYDCTGPATQNPSTFVQCYSPVMPWHDQTRNSHISNELRLSTPDDWRLRGLFGLYQENFTIADNMNFPYNNLPGCNTAADIATAEANNAAGAPGGVCVGSIGPVPSSSDMDPNPRSSVVNYGEDERRGYSQYAAFTSIDFDIIPKVLTITGGTRYYHYNEYEFGTRYDGNCVDEIVCSPIYGGGNIIDPTSPNPGGANAGGSYPNHQAPYYPLGDQLPRLPQPRQSDLAHHAGRHAVLHLLAGFPSGRLQPLLAPALRPGPHVCEWRDAGRRPGGHRLRRDRRHGGRLPVPEPVQLCTGHGDQQRSRLQERVVRSPAAVQCLRVRHEVEERPVRVLRSHGRLRLIQLRDQRPGLHDQGRGTADRRQADQRPDAAGFELREQQQSGQRGVPDVRTTSRWPAPASASPRPSRAAR